MTLFSLLGPIDLRPHKELLSRFKTAELPPTILYGTQCTGRSPRGSVAPRPAGRWPGPVEAEVRTCEVLTGAPSVHPPRDPAATHPPHRLRPACLKACSPPAYRLLLGGARSGCSGALCTQPAALSPLAGRDEVRRQRGRHGFARGAPARPEGGAVKKGHRSKRASVKRASAAAALDRMLDRRCWAGTRTPPQPLLDTPLLDTPLLGTRAVALGRRAGLGSSGGLRGLPRARGGGGKLAMAHWVHWPNGHCGRAGHFGRAGALSREMHGHGELVRVELAVAVDVREVPHLTQSVHR